MSEISNAIGWGIATGLRDTTNLIFGGLTARSIHRSGLDPFMTLYPNLDSPSGFSSWAHPSYASTTNVIANVNGLDTTWAPFTDSLSSWFGNSWLGGYGGGLFGYGFSSFPSSSLYITSDSWTHLGHRPGFRGWF